MSQWDRLALNLKCPSVFHRFSFLLSWIRLRVLSFSSPPAPCRKEEGSSFVWGSAAVAACIAGGGTLAIPWGSSFLFRSALVSLDESPQGVRGQADSSQWFIPTGVVVSRCLLSGPRFCAALWWVHTATFTGTWVKRKHSSLEHILALGVISLKGFPLMFSGIAETGLDLGFEFRKNWWFLG